MKGLAKTASRMANIGQHGILLATPVQIMYEPDVPGVMFPVVCPERGSPVSLTLQDDGGSCP